MEEFLSYFSPDVIFLAVVILGCLFIKYLLHPELPCRRRTSDNLLDVNAYAECFKISELLKFATEHYIEFVRKTDMDGNHPGETDEDCRSLLAIANCNEFKEYYPKRHASNIEVLVRLYMQLLYEEKAKFQKSVHTFIFLQILAGSKDSAKSLPLDNIHLPQLLKNMISVSKERFQEIDNKPTGESVRPIMSRSISTTSSVSSVPFPQSLLRTLISSRKLSQPKNSASLNDDASEVTSHGPSSESLQAHSVFSDVTIEATLKIIVEENDQIEKSIGILQARNKIEKEEVRSGSSTASSKRKGSHTKNESQHTSTSTGDEKLKRIDNK
ncbi:MAG: hypothetical protein MHMPM18_000314 [Marteilia pararefringens]